MQSDPAGLHPMLRTIAMLAAVVFLSGCEGPYVDGQNPQPPIVVARVQAAYYMSTRLAGASLQPRALPPLDHFLSGTCLPHRHPIGLPFTADTHTQPHPVLRHLPRKH